MDTSLKDEADEIGILLMKDKKVINQFLSDEFLQLSMPIVKINQYGSRDDRQLVITTQRILLMNNLKIRRKVSLKQLIGLTLSTRSFEFCNDQPNIIVLHFSQDYEDDDLRLYSEKRPKIVEVLVKVVSLELKAQIPSYQISEPFLKAYQTFKDDRKSKGTKLPQNLTPNFLFYLPEKERQRKEEEREKARKSARDYKEGEKQLYNRRNDNLTSLDDLDPKKILQKGSLCQIFLATSHKRPNEQFCMKMMTKPQHLECEKEQVDLTHFVNSLDTFTQGVYLEPLEYVFESKDLYTFVVGYMAGGDLYTILRAESVLGETRAKFIAASVIVALEHLHALGYVYKDLKPENILMDQDGYIYLTDFGMCRSSSKNQYRTLEYTAPEAKFSPQTCQSDFWQLGILVYEILFSFTPFVGDTDELTLHFIQSCPLVFPENISVSPYCQDFINQLLKKNPQQRLGATNGCLELKDHPWFGDMHFDQLSAKKVYPPYRPKKEQLGRASLEIQIDQDDYRSEQRQMTVSGMQTVRYGKQSHEP